MKKKYKKIIPVTIVVVAVSVLLVFIGLYLLSEGIQTNNEFWVNLAPELFGAGIWTLTLFVILTVLGIFGLVKVKKTIYS